MARTGARSFIGSITSLLNEFYGTVGQNLTTWKPQAPKLPQSTDPTGTDLPTTEASAEPAMASLP